MALLVKCECGREFRAREKYQGRKTSCPACKRAIVIDGVRVPDHDVFISYAKKDKAVADAVCAGLEADKIRCWVAPRDIEPGTEWADSIMTAIADSRVMVIVFSSSSNTSKHVIREVEHAVNKNVTIIPFRIENIEPSGGMAYYVSVAQWLDALSDPLSQHIETLRDSVGRVLTGSPGAVKGVAEPPHAKRKRGRLPLLLACLALVVVAAIGITLAMKGQPPARLLSDGNQYNDGSDDHPSQNPPPTSGSLPVDEFAKYPLLAEANAAWSNLLPNEEGSARIERLKVMADDLELVSLDRIRNSIDPMKRINRQMRAKMPAMYPRPGPGGSRVNPVQQTAEDASSTPVDLPPAGKAFLINAPLLGARATGGASWVLLNISASDGPPTAIMNGSMLVRFESENVARKMYDYAVGQTVAVVVERVGEWRPKDTAESAEDGQSMPIPVEVQREFLCFDDSRRGFPGSLPIWSVKGLGLCILGLEDRTWIDASGTRAITPDNSRELRSTPGAILRSGLATSMEPKRVEGVYLGVRNDGGLVHLAMSVPGTLEGNTYVELDLGSGRQLSEFRDYHSGDTIQAVVAIKGIGPSRLPKDFQSGTPLASQLARMSGAPPLLGLGSSIGEFPFLSSAGLTGDCKSVRLKDNPKSEVSAGSAIRILDTTEDPITSTPALQSIISIETAHSLGNAAIGRPVEDKGKLRSIRRRDGVTVLRLTLANNKYGLGEFEAFSKIDGLAAAMADYVCTEDKVTFGTSGSPVEHTVWVRGTVRARETTPFHLSNAIVPLVEIDEVWRDTDEESRIKISEGAKRRPTPVLNELGQLLRDWPTTPTVTFVATAEGLSGRAVSFRVEEKSYHSQRVEFPEFDENALKALVRRDVSYRVAGRVQTTSDGELAITGTKIERTNADPPPEDLAISAKFSSFNGRRLSLSDAPESVASAGQSLWIDLSSGGLGENDLSDYNRGDRVLVSVIRQEREGDKPLMTLRSMRRVGNARSEITPEGRRFAIPDWSQESAAWKAAKSAERDSTVELAGVVKDFHEGARSGRVSITMSRLFGGKLDTCDLDLPNSTKLAEWIKGLDADTEVGLRVVVKGSATANAPNRNSQDSGRTPRTSDRGRPARPTTPAPSERTRSQSGSREVSRVISVWRLDDPDHPISMDSK